MISRFILNTFVIIPSIASVLCFIYLGLLLFYFTRIFWRS